jgi:predicted nucleic acid-binding protein
LIVLDTTVLLYAVGNEHPLRTPSRDVVSAIGDGRVAATTSAAVIQEFAHVRARRRGRRDAATQAAAFAELLAPLLPVTHDEVGPALELFERHPQLDAFDAFLAAAALAQDARALVSADRAFAAIAGLQHIMPGTPEFDRLVG